MRCAICEIVVYQLPAAGGRTSRNLNRGRQSLTASPNLTLTQIQTTTLSLTQNIIIIIIIIMQRLTRHVSVIRLTNRRHTQSLSQSLH